MAVMPMDKSALFFKIVSYSRENVSLEVSQWWPQLSLLILSSFIYGEVSIVHCSVYKIRFFRRVVGR